MRFPWFSALFCVLVVKNSEVSGSVTASCIITTNLWIDINQALVTCQPNLGEVDDEDFLIETPASEATEGLAVVQNKKFKFIPKNLHQVFPNLMAITIFNCSIAVINEVYFQKLTKLTILHLKHNEIEQIAINAFADLVSLEVLALNVNRIHFLGQTTFASLRNLKNLFLSVNEIYSLHPKIFSTLANVDNLDLEYNVISSLDENIFATMTNLKNISLLGNSLESIPGKLFENNRKLEKIWLQNNQIQFIQGNMFDHMLELKYVDLRNNSCVNQLYYQSSQFESMKNDLNRDCQEQFDEGMLEDRIKNLEKVVDSLKPKLDSLKTYESRVKILENEEKELQDALDRQNVKILQQIELLGIRIDALNRTSEGAGFILKGTST